MANKVRKPQRSEQRKPQRLPQRAEMQAEIGLILDRLDAEIPEAQTRMNELPERLRNARATIAA